MRIEVRLSVDDWSDTAKIRLVNEYLSEIETVDRYFDTFISFLRVKLCIFYQLILWQFELHWLFHFTPYFTIFTSKNCRIYFKYVFGSWVVFTALCRYLLHEINFSILYPRVTSLFIHHSHIDRNTFRRVVSFCSIQKIPHFKQQTVNV